jgi:hypothetical protein
MGDPIELSRRSIRQELITEVLFDRLPEPPEEMLRLPGVRRWFSAMRLARERDIQALHRLIHKIEGTGG